MRALLFIIPFILIFPSMACAESSSLEKDFLLKVNENEYFALTGAMEVEGVFEAIQVSIENLPINPNYLHYLSIKNPELFQDVYSLIEENPSFIPFFVDNITLRLCKVYVTNPYTQELKSFDNVKLKFLNTTVAVCGSSMIFYLNKGLEYAVLSMINSSKILPEIKIPLIVLITDDKMEITVKNSHTYVLFSLSMLSGEGAGTIIIEDENGHTLWEGSAESWIAVTNEKNLYLNINSPLLLIPSDKKSMVIIEESEKIPNMERLVKRVTKALKSNFSLTSLPSILSNLTSMFSGIFVSIKTNSSINIEGKKYRFGDIGLIRYRSCLFLPKGKFALIEGQGKLFFLGDYLYNDVAVYNLGELSIPVQPIEIWILSIGVFILFYFVLRKETGNRIKLNLSERARKKMKWIAFACYVGGIIFAFLAFDSEFHYLFGISALSGKSLLVSFAFLSLQLFCMGITYLFFAFPVRIASYGVLEWAGIGKEGKGFGKGLGLLVMAFLGLPYIPYILNSLTFLIREVVHDMLASF